MRGLKKNEHTSAGISGQHFGHLKTCALDNLLASFESSICNVPLTTGYSPIIWQDSIIAMIKKRINSLKLKDLQSLVLLEADFNFNNKLLGRSTMQHAENKKKMAIENNGSRKGLMAVDHALNKKLIYDIILQHHIPAILCSNDAKLCYDRILHSIASLAYQRLGVSLPPVKCMLERIQNMHHHIYTSFGVSAFTLSSKNALIPHQRILQGNGAALTTWVIISTPLINMLRKSRTQRQIYLSHNIRVYTYSEICIS